MIELEEYLKGVLNFTDSEWRFLQRELVSKSIKAQTVLTPKGAVASHMFFVKSGLLRTYHLRDDKEICTYFADDNQFISAYASFITQVPSQEYLQAIEDSELLGLNYQSLLNLYTESPVFEKLGRVLAEKNYLCVLDRTLSLQSKTAKQKYAEFLKSYSPKIINNVPLYMIASFLGIAPESLSRIRKQVLIS